MKSSVPMAPSALLPPQQSLSSGVSSGGRSVTKGTVALWGASAALFLLGLQMLSSSPEGRAPEGGEGERGLIAGAAIPSASGNHGGSCDAWTRRGAPGGHWERDLELAPLHQYGPEVPMNYLWNADLYHKPNPKDPKGTQFRAATTYFWRDAPETEEACGGRVMPLNVDDFCRVVDELKLDRIMYVGDSLIYYQAYALRSQIGSTIEVNRPVKYGNNMLLPEAYFRVEHDCPGNDGNEGRKVTIEYSRSNHLRDMYDNTAPNPVNGRHKTIDTIPHWTESYRTFPGRTLLVVNTGLHFMATTQDQKKDVAAALEYFVDTIEDIYTPGDLVVMRTTPGGHPDCLSATQPHSSIDEYEETFKHIREDLKEKVKMYNWVAIPQVNQAIREAVARYNDERRNEERSAAARSVKGGRGPTHIQLLEVTHMTHLRPDGHRTGPDNHEPHPHRPFDCLHYSLPGPVDWWNNLMFANLAREDGDGWAVRRDPTAVSKAAKVKAEGKEESKLRAGAAREPEPKTVEK